MLAAPFAVLALVATAHRADAATFTRGPYQQDVSSRSAAILAGLDAPHAATLTLSTPAPAGTTDAHPTTIEIKAPASDALEIVATGLTPATHYTWSLTLDDGTKSDGTLVTAPEDDRPFSFLLYGDNRTDAASHAAVVQRMQSTPDGDFLVQTGDMVYDGADLDLWTQFFSIERDLLRNRCLFTAIGNHEIGLPTSDGALRFARLFRNAGPPAANERYYTFRWGDARFFMLDAQDDFASEERDWLEGALKSADGEAGLVWRFVVLHHGPYSSGLHGPNQSLILAHVPEMLRAHHVDVVFAGHDHIYERGESNGLKYVVSGGGGAPLYTEHRDEPNAFRFEAVHHFIDVDVTKTGATLTVIRMDGSVLEKCAIGPGGSSGWGTPAGSNAGACVVGAPASPNAAAVGSPPAVPPRRACDCDFSLTGAQWIGAVAATLLLLAAGVRRVAR
jgi:hypothetical protein